MPAKKTDRQESVVVTPAQLRGARGLLNWSVSQLAEETGLAMNTVRKAENVRHFMTVYRPNAELLKRTLEAAGVIFIEADEHGVGVRLHDPIEPNGSRRNAD